MPLVKTFSKNSVRGHGRNRTVWTPLGPSISSTGIDTSGVTGSYTFDPNSGTKPVINISGSRFTNVNRVTYSRGGVVYFDESVITKASFDSSLDNTGQRLSDSLIKIQIPLYNAGSNGLPSSWNGSAFVDITLTLYDGLYGSTGTSTLRIYFKPYWQTASGQLGSNIPVGGTTPFMQDDTVNVSVQAEDGNSQSIALTYSRISGSFPSGVSLNTSTGQISGNPSNINGRDTDDDSQTWSFTIRATSSADTNLYADRTFNLYQQADFSPHFDKPTGYGSVIPGPNPFVFDDKDEGDGWNAGQNIEDRIVSVGKNSYLFPGYPSDAYKFELISGSIPAGLEFQGSTDFNDYVDGWSATGYLGAVAADTTYNWTVRATTPSGKTRNQQYQITVLNSAPVYPNASLGIESRYYTTISPPHWKMTFCSPASASPGGGTACHVNISGGLLSVTANIQYKNGSPGLGVDYWYFVAGDYSNDCAGNSGSTYGQLTITRTSRTGSFGGTISEPNTDFPTTNGQSITYTADSGQYKFIYWGVDWAPTTNGSYTVVWNYSVSGCANVTAIRVTYNVTVLTTITF